MNVRHIAVVLACLAVAACASRTVRMEAMPPIANLAQPAPGVVTGGAVEAGHVAALERAGVNHVIDLRGDAETPDFDEAAAVRDAGLRYDNLAIAGADDLSLDTVRAFDRLVRGADAPVLVHCGSSNRVGALAALRAGWLEGKSVEDAVAEGKRWGLKGLEPAVREKLAKPL